MIKKKTSQIASQKDYDFLQTSYNLLKKHHEELSETLCRVVEKHVPLTPCPRCATATKPEFYKTGLLVCVVCGVHLTGVTKGEALLTWCKLYKERFPDY